MKAKTVTYSLLASSLLAASPLVLAHEAGDMLLRFGGGVVSPKSNNSEVVSVDDGTSATITFTYMFKDNWAVDVLAAWPFKHDINLVSDGSKVGSTEHLPPTVSLQYYFTTDTLFQPYVGVGVNYTNFFSEKTTGALQGTNLKLDDSWGLAAQVGVDFMLNEKWFLNLDARYIDIESKAYLDGAFVTKVDISPWVYSAQAGFRF